MKHISARYRIRRKITKFFEGRVPQGLFQLFLDRDHRALLRAVQRVTSPPPAVALGANPLWVFVVLQYNNVGVTVQCVESIRSISERHRSEIVVVDNASPDKAGDVLQDHYASDSRMHILLRGENGGFAKGNNAGYVLAKKDLGADFVLVINNDIVFEDKNVLQHVLDEYRHRAFSVLCPDIFVPEAKLHQNPMRFQLATKKDSLDYIQHLESSIRQIETGTTKLAQPSSHGTRRRPSRRLEGAIIPHGAAYVFSPVFLRDFELPFDERTFMYGEESILGLKVLARGGRIVYSPKVRLQHRSMASTNRLDYAAYYLFRYKNLLASTKIYLDVLEQVTKDFGT
jgi:GT2 family glycosyltransferase